MLEQVQEATRFIRSKTAAAPAIGLILGTGLGALANDVQIETTD